MMTKASNMMIASPLATGPAGEKMESARAAAGASATTAAHRNDQGPLAARQLIFTPNPPSAWTVANSEYAGTLHRCDAGGKGRFAAQQLRISGTGVVRANVNSQKSAL